MSRPTYESLIEEIVRRVIREEVRAVLPELAPRHEPADVLSVRSVATALELSPKTVRRLIARGEIRGIRVGDSTRIRRSDLEAYLFKRTNPDPQELAGEAARIISLERRRRGEK